MSKKIVIVGATSSIAEHCARLWITEGVSELILVVRDAVKAEPIAIDLRVRSPNTVVSVRTTEFLDSAAITEFVQEVSASACPDIVLIAHGSLPDQQICQQDLNAGREALELNAISPVLFAEAFAAQFAKAGKGTLAIIGSVAGDRGRKSNYVYGAAKGLVTRYAQGLQHRFAGTNVKVVLIKPGPTDTPMTAHLKGEGAKLANVGDVAQQIVSGVASGQPVIYAPGRWAVIMMVIRHLPRFIFNRMNI
ncbi:MULTISPECIES: SDR family NAD(P)-dependent oxidoreductase [unclassified Pseudomonas]|uniref:SDR family NAD(P)-dependent oxidoreductase n=1 Tax=unclassified Pseudomonas TaxID=196821 RepID=UPI002AC97FF4|nr:MULTISPECIES: SDR family NAD(P)-dependent oxidoreductase [unclassified Pseudomonas]MEB0047236.1 SDR family NAD(P)-dependent oxidoreductase [Pseudomonas sp. Dout3]MEB0096876.1 SDR family NAD(P)-dependent oxidoreductase [Pseudomonas sp. DC1.2]WPX57388.1 SDR family NAD(P)-dependent oxidoreductase [Pseudomonas sp. DC1.2]